MGPDEIWAHRRMQEASRAISGKGCGETVVMADDYGNEYGSIDHQTEVGKVLAI